MLHVRRRICGRRQARRDLLLRGTAPHCSAEPLDPLAAPRSSALMACSSPQASFAASSASGTAPRVSRPSPARPSADAVSGLPRRPRILYGRCARQRPWPGGAGLPSHEWWSSCELCTHFNVFLPTHRIRFRKDTLAGEKRGRSPRVGEAFQTKPVGQELSLSRSHNATRIYVWPGCGV